MKEMINIEDIYNLLINKSKSGHLSSNIRINKNTIYFNKVVNLPVLTCIDGIVTIFYDKRIYANIFKIISVLIDNNVDFNFSISKLYFKKYTDDEINHIITIDNYLSCIENHYYKLRKIKFDIISSLYNYIKANDCNDAFEHSYSIFSKEKFKTYMNWYNGNTCEIIKDDNTRFELKNLRRSIKLCSLLN